MIYYIEWASSTFFGLFHQHKYCPLWDAKLNQLLDEHGKTAKLGDHTIQLGNANVWIANRFYSYGHSWANRELREHRPSVRTMIRLAKLEDIYQIYKKQKREDAYKRAIDSL